MEILENFKKRAEEVNIYFEFVTKTDKIETYKQDKKDFSTNITRDLQKILRANCFLVLYNLVEATIKNSIWQIYDTIEDEKLRYGCISEKMKEIWLEEKRKELNELTSSNKVKNSIKSFIEKSESEHYISFSKKRVSVSGNLDYRSIEKLIIKYGFYGQLKLNNEKILRKALLKIKSERNALAHGNKSFRESAEIITIQQLNEYKTEVIDYLLQVTQNVIKYIEDKKYKN